jgi:hypothetical protein
MGWGGDGDELLRFTADDVLLVMFVCRSMSFPC